MIRKQLLPLGVILISAMLLAPLIRDFIRDVLVVPLLYLVWIGRIVFNTIPQAGFWGCFLLLALLTAGASLLKRGSFSARIHQAKTVQPGRVEKWANLIGQAAQEEYYQWRLAQGLRELLVDTLAYETRLTPKQIKQRMRNAQLELPPEIQAYLLASLKSLSYLSAPRFPFGSSPKPASPLNLNPERVTQFLEDRYRDT